MTTPRYQAEANFVFETDHGCVVVCESSARGLEKAERLAVRIADLLNRDDAHDVLMGAGLQ